MSSRFVKPLRALLFVPGSDEGKLAKVASLDADAIIIDLEDAVPLARKEHARALAAQWLPAIPAPVLSIVRVNPEADQLGSDLDAVVGSGVDAILLPKVESVESLHELDLRLSALEQHLARDAAITIFALIESARGVVTINHIARHAPGRLLTFCVGPADLATDLNLPHGSGHEALVYARSAIVLAARAAGLPSAIDGPFSGVRNVEALSADSRHSRSLGFQGRLVLHPDHVGIVREAYVGLNDAGLDFAHRVVSAFLAERDMGGGVVRVDDMVVDEPVFQRYVRLLRERESLNGGDDTSNAHDRLHQVGIREA